MYYIFFYTNIPIIYILVYLNMPNNKFLLFYLFNYQIILINIIKNDRMKCIKLNGVNIIQISFRYLLTKQIRISGFQYLYINAF